MAASACPIARCEEPLPTHPRASAGFKSVQRVKSANASGAPLQRVEDQASLTPGLGIRRREGGHFGERRQRPRQVARSKSGAPLEGSRGGGRQFQPTGGRRGPAARRRQRGFPAFARSAEGRGSLQGAAVRGHDPTYLPASGRKKTTVVPSQDSTRNS